MDKKEVTKKILKHRKKLIELMLKAFPKLCNNCKKAIIRKELNDLNHYCKGCQVLMKPYFESFKDIVQ